MGERSASPHPRGECEIVRPQSFGHLAACGQTSPGIRGALHPRWSASPLSVLARDYPRTANPPGAIASKMSAKKITVVGAGHVGGSLRAAPGREGASLGGGADRHSRGHPAGQGARPVAKRTGRGVRHARRRHQRLRPGRGLRALHRDRRDCPQAGNEPRRPAPHQCLHREFGWRGDRTRGTRIDRDRRLESARRDGVRDEGDDRIPPASGSWGWPASSTPRASAPSSRWSST